MGIVLTQEGYNEKLHALQKVRRKLHEVFPKKLQEAVVRGGSDLRENTEFQYLIKERDRFDSERQRLEKELEGEVVDPPSGKSIGIGSRVKLLNLTSGEEKEYKLVSPQEANCEKGKISSESPCGRALLGKRAGAVVSVEAPGGLQKYKILRVVNRSAKGGVEVQKDFKKLSGGART